MHYECESRGVLPKNHKRCVFDNSKIKRLAPDMGTHVPFHRGVRIALDYILSHPEECQRDDPEFDAWCDRVIEAQEKAKEFIRGI